MFVCSMCNKVVSSSSEIKSHLKYIHNLGESRFSSLKCPKINCPNIYNTWSGLLKHLITHNISQSSLGFCQSSPTFEENNASQGGQEYFVQSCNVESVSAPSQPLNLLQEFTELLGHFSSAVLSTGVTQSTLDKVLIEFKYVLSQLIEKMLADLSINFDLSEVTLKFRSILPVFDSFKSSHRRMNYFKGTNKMIVPVEKSLGTRTEIRTRDNKRMQIIISDNFTYVPLLSTLTTVLKCSEVMSYFQQRDFRDISKINSFADSGSFSKNQLFKNYPNALKIQLFLDEFETVNPLGSKKGIHKLGAVYFTIQNFPSFLNSKLKFIHLLALYYAEDCKKYGLNKILNVILPDIKKLEVEGLVVEGVGHFFGTVSNVSHDNLGANGLYGFNESFSSTYYCRFCLISGEEAQNCYKHSEMPIRNYESHVDHVLNATFGVKTTCALDLLTYYNFIDNPSVDLMHDLLEGVVQYELKLVLRKLIEMKCFTLDTLNARLQAHNFGRIESKNKPSSIRLDQKGNSLGLKAAQSWTFCRFLPVIICDLIQSDEQLKFWRLIILLLEVMSYSFSPRFSEALISRLDSSVIIHHQYFREIFPQSKLIPKQHFMCHYAHVVRSSGPLISLWCMRYEAKHNYFCQLAGNIRNFRNIAYSLATRHEQAHSHLWNSDEEFDILKFDFLHECAVADISESYDLLETLRSDFGNAELEGSTKIYITKQVWYKGTNYRPDYFICHSMGHIYPKFCKIREIIVTSNDVCYLICCSYKVCEFDEKIWAFRVEKEEGSVIVQKLVNIYSYECVEIHTNCKIDGEYLIFKHYL